jgi:hypothetical protein
VTSSSVACVERLEFFGVLRYSINKNELLRTTVNSRNSFRDGQSIYLLLMLFLLSRNEDVRGARWRLQW